MSGEEPVGASGASEAQLCYWGSVRTLVLGVWDSKEDACTFPVGGRRLRPEPRPGRILDVTPQSWGLVDVSGPGWPPSTGSPGSSTPLQPEPHLVSILHSPLALLLALVCVTYLLIFLPTVYVKFLQFCYIFNSKKLITSNFYRLRFSFGSQQKPKLSALKVSVAFHPPPPAVAHGVTSPMAARLEAWA